MLLLQIGRIHGVEWVLKLGRQNTQSHIMTGFDKSIVIWHYFSYFNITNPVITLDHTTLNQMEAKEFFFTA